MIGQAIFGATKKFKLMFDFRDLLTCGDLIIKLTLIMIVCLNRVLKFKHFEVYFVVLRPILQEIQ